MVTGVYWAVRWTDRYTVGDRALVLRQSDVGYLNTGVAMRIFQSGHRQREYPRGFWQIQPGDSVRPQDVGFVP